MFVRLGWSGLWVEPLVAREENGNNAALVSEIIMWSCDGSIFSSLTKLQSPTPPHISPTHCCHFSHHFIASAFSFSLPRKRNRFNGFLRWRGHSGDDFGSSRSARMFTLVDLCGDGILKCCSGRSVVTRLQNRLVRKLGGRMSQHSGGGDHV